MECAQQKARHRLFTAGDDVDSRTTITIPKRTRRYVIENCSHESHERLREVVKETPQ